PPLPLRTVFRTQFPTHVAHELVPDGAVLGDPSIALGSPFRITKEQGDGAPLVLIGPRKPVARVRADRVEDGIAQSAAPLVDREGGGAEPTKRGETMEAVRQPITRVVGEDDDGWQRLAFTERVRIRLHRRVVDLASRLRFGRSADQVELEVHLFAPSRKKAT